MRTFSLDSLPAIIACSLLVQGLVGALVVLPIFSINWIWNSLVAPSTMLPEIVWWQASLLYLAVAGPLYLSGVIRIKVKAEKID